MKKTKKRLHRESIRRGDDAVTLGTLQKAAAVVGRQVRLELV
jgi:hypothetical protein